MGKEVARPEDRYDYVKGFWTDAQIIDLRGHAADARKAGNIARDSLYHVGEALVLARDMFDANGGGANDGKWVKSAWKDWLIKEVGLNAMWAARIMQATKAIAGLTLKSDQLPSINAVLEGEKSGSDAVKNMVATTPDMTVAKVKAVAKDVAAQKAKGDPLPTPDKAREIADKTGAATEAKDGHIYLGDNKGQEDAKSAKTSLVFGMLRAVEAINEIKVTPKDWVSTALPYFIGETDLSIADLDASIKYLTDIRAAMKDGRKIIDAKPAPKVKVKAKAKVKAGAKAKAKKKA